MVTSEFNRQPITIQHSNRKILPLLKSLVAAGIEASDPLRAITRSLARRDHTLTVQGTSYDLSTYDRIVCMGAGKASGRMAAALEQVLGRYLGGGIVIVKDGYGTPCKNIHLLEAGHPIPDRRGVNATKQVISRVHSLTRNDLVIVLLSGGASSLLCAPAPGITLADKQRTTNLLLRSGATIQEINIVRKHLSTVKGGQLAQTTLAQSVTFIMSDVLGDDLSTIGSGPTVPDRSTFQDAKDILKQFTLWGTIPSAVRRHINKGRSGHVPETWKPTKHQSSRHRHVILGNNRQAIEGVAAAARKLKIKPVILPMPLQGEAREIGSILGSLGRDLVESGNPVHPPACLIAGGEPTVTVTGKGRGGRAQECVLAAAQELAGLKNVIVAGFGTDGTDGPTDAAGAVADGQTLKRAWRKGLEIHTFLDNHDSYHFFKKVGGQIITGPTGTNVNDVYLILAL